MYDLRSEEDDDDGLVAELLEGLLVLFCAFDTLSSADIRCVVVLIPLLEGRVLLEGRAVLEGRSLFEGLSLPLEALDGLVADAGVNPADAGLLVVPATFNPPPPGFGLVGAGASPPPGCGL